jgi:hypothetical protein
MKNFSPIIILIILFISCSENNPISINLEDNVSESCEINDPRLTDPNFQGTICCFQRNSVLGLNTPVEYEYLTNLESVSVLWQVESGNIEIISGQNSNIVTIILGENFNDGVIRVIGTSSNGLRCSELVEITKN